MNYRHPFIPLLFLFSASFSLFFLFSKNLHFFFFSQSDSNRSLHCLADLGASSAAAPASLKAVSNYSFSWLRDGAEISEENGFGGTSGDRPEYVEKVWIDAGAGEAFVYGLVLRLGEIQVRASSFTKNQTGSLCPLVKHSY